MQTQDRIAQQLNINRSLVKGAEPREIQRRIDFIKTTLRQSGCKALVLGISGGVDSLTAGRLCQLAVEQLRSEDYAARFIALRLPYKNQADESDAQAALDFINPDHIDTLNIAASVDGLMASLTTTEASAAHVDFIKGNVKARTRMIA
jgi:NAD+ synthase